MAEYDGTRNHDSFVIIFSTNADAIAETIGAISENTVAVQSVNYLLHKDVLEEAAVAENLKPLNERSRSATTSALATLFTDDYATNSNGGINPELTILRTVAIALEPERSANLNTIEEAKIWFSTVK